jgi:tetratricopeptide (TPR) repeat protein
MTTMTPKLQTVVSNSTKLECSDTARLLIHANDLYKMYNSVSTPATERQTSLDHALKLIMQVISYDANNTPAINLLGRIELDRGNIKSAEALFEQCLQHMPNNTQYLSNMGYLQLMNDEPDLALQYFNDALAIDKSLENAFLGIARVQQSLRNYDVAYLHYRSLVNYGHDDDTILQGMLNCCAHIKIDSYQVELEKDLLNLFSYKELAHERLGHFAAALISKKYDLENPNAPIDILQVAYDPLVYHSLLKCTLPNPFVEEFITLLRQSILLEAAETRQLRDELQLLAVAIATYNERNNYALVLNEDEKSKVDHFNLVLAQTLQQPWRMEDVTGALIVVGMYQSFFAQAYAVNLTELQLNAWPDALIPLMSGSLYRRAEREGFKQQFPEKQDELLIAKEDMPAPFPRWNKIDFFNHQSLKSEMRTSFGIDTSLLPDRLLLLVAGVDASQKAFSYARHFTDVDVLAVENSLENLAESHLKAETEKLDNIAFWPLSLARRFLQDGNQIHFASLSGDASSIDASFISLVKNSLNEQGVLNVKLVKTPDIATKDIQQLINKQSLKRTSANIRALRSTILADKYSEYWGGVIKNEYFYSVDGCRQAWFTDNNQTHILGSVLELLAKPEWTLTKVLNHHRKTVALTLAEKHLHKFADNKNIKSEYSVYFVKK